MFAEIAMKQDSSKHLTLAAMSLGYGVVQLDVTIVNVAINSIGQSFGGGVAGLQWVEPSGGRRFMSPVATDCRSGLQSGRSWHSSDRTIRTRARSNGVWLDAEDNIYLAQFDRAVSKLTRR